MTTQIHHAIAEGQYRPALGRQFLGRCPACHAAHPLARKPPMPDGVCPDCGSPSGTVGQYRETWGRAPGVWGAIAHAFHLIGETLAKAAKGLDP